MFEATSAEIRRFFDLLSSIFCSLIFGFISWMDLSNQLEFDPYYLSLIFAIPLFFYLFFYRLVWQNVAQKAFDGYFNFILISIPSFTLTLFFSSVFVHKSYPNFIGNLFSVESVFKLGLYNFFAVLPMVFLSFIGILTAWKFSKKIFLR